MQLVLFNHKDLRIFNYFHYLDVYGALRAVDAFKDMQDFNDKLSAQHDGWRIYYPGTAYTQEELAASIRSYYEYRDGLLPTQDIQLSDYDYLSDVYVL